VAIEGGEVVGVAGGQLHVYAEGPQPAFLGATVRADRRGHGLGTELFDRALAHVRAAGARRALAESAGDEGRRFLERRGFASTQTRRYSQVDPREVDLSGLEPLRSRLAADGFVVVPVSECAPEDVRAIDLEASRDIPMGAQIADIPLVEWTEQFWRHPFFSHTGSVAVLHGGRPVAIALLRTDGQRAMNDMTGTLRPFRGRGLARTMKLTQLDWAARAGIAAVLTENDETNMAMLAVNTRLGYRPFLTVSSYARDLG
jgi:GNAT superfamily N-acetyltransferase